MEATTEPTTFDDKETRKDAMAHTIETWCADLTDLVAEARASEQFQEWLEVQSRFHDYSYRNTLLIQSQHPEATKVAGYKTWQTEFDRQVKEDEQAIWIWAPIIAKQCPECANSPSYHADSACAYTETPPEEWQRGPVAFRPVPVFDVSQTQGEALPELETDATDSPEGRFQALRDASEELGVSLEIIPTEAWDHGSADGVCKTDIPDSESIPVALKERDERAAMAGTLIHEYAHALLHSRADEASIERARRELEAEAVAYVVGRHLGLDMSGSAFYLAAWQGDEPEVVMGRLGRISRTAQTLIKAVGEEM
jgi:hypothetical protein